MKMANCKSLSLLVFTLFQLTVQKNTAPLSFPLNFVRLSKSSASNAHALASSPPLERRLQFKYSMALIASLPIGTPPQTVQMVLDTGSQLPWIRCGRNTSKKGRPFDSSLSSSFSFLHCNDPTCQKSNLTLGTTCHGRSRCHYSYFYADGTSAEGSLVREKFNFSISQSTPLLIIGCTKEKDSSGAEGVLGMNLGPLSFISQAKVQRFSYCVPLGNSVRTKNNNNYNLTGTFYLGPNPNSPTFQYISLLSYPQSQSKPNLDPLAYTVPMESISIDGVNLNISKTAFLADSSGSGQTMMDSGTQYTYLVGAAYSKVSERVVKLAGSKLNKGYAYEGLNTCFNGNSSEIGDMIGEMVFGFEKRVQITIPKERTLVDAAPGVSCFAIESSDSLERASNIIGNFHQQNLWVEFDIANKRVGFGKADCSKSV